MVKQYKAWFIEVKEEQGWCPAILFYGPNPIHTCAVSCFCENFEVDINDVRVRRVQKYSEIMRFQAEMRELEERGYDTSHLFLTPNNVEAGDQVLFDDGSMLEYGGDVNEGDVNEE